MPRPFCRISQRSLLVCRAAEEASALLAAVWLKDSAARRLAVDRLAASHCCSPVRRYYLRALNSLCGLRTLK